MSDLVRNRPTPGRVTVEGSPGPDPYGIGALLAKGGCADPLLATPEIKPEPRVMLCGGVFVGRPGE